MVSVNRLSKVYGKTQVLDSVTLAVPQGAIYGFIGPNGAGKSTTMKILLGLVRPSSGDVVVLGDDVTAGKRQQVMMNIGGMIEEPAGYGHLTGAENLEIVRSLLGFPASNIPWALDIVGLTSAKDKLVKNYSLGMKQRLGIAIAIVRKPKLLILDEPTNGLDPYGIEEVRKLLAWLALEENTTIMVSSHVLDELEKISTHFGILNEGKVVFEGTRSELMSLHSPSLFIRTSEPNAAIAAVNAGNVVPNGIEIPNVVDDEVSQICRRLLAVDIPFYEVTRTTQGLEAIFMSLTKNRRHSND